MLAHHPPAAKVAGRRLSVTSKTKLPTSSHSREGRDSFRASPEPNEPTDYPRPAHPIAHAKERRKLDYDCVNHVKTHENFYSDKNTARRLQGAVKKDPGYANIYGVGSRVTQPAAKGADA